MSTLYYNTPPKQQKQYSAKNAFCRRIQPDNQKSDIITHTHPSGLESPLSQILIHFL